LLLAMLGISMVLAATACGDAEVAAELEEELAAVAQEASVEGVPVELLVEAANPPPGT